MPIYLGANKLDALHLGATEIARVYLGTSLVYDNGGAPTPGAGILFDNGWVDGIGWAGNMLTRPQYTSIATYNFANVDSLGCMELIVNSEDNYSAVNHNCHVCTSDVITIPSGVTEMKITYICSDGVGNVTPYIKFGAVSASAATAVDDTGGQLSAWLEADKQVLTTLTLALNSGIAGSSLRPIVNMRRSAQASNSARIRIYKVWFE